METVTKKMQRIEKAFFKKELPPNNKKPKKPQVKVSLYLISALVIILLFISLFALKNFDFTLILAPKKQLSKTSDINILDQNIKVSVSGEKIATISNKKNISFTTSKIYPATISIDFEKLNGLRGKIIQIITNKLTSDMALEVIFRDNYHYSNSLDPLKIYVNSKDEILKDTIINIPVPENENLQINWDKISHIRIKIYPLSDMENFVMIKDVSFKNKEDSI